MYVYVYIYIYISCCPARALTGVQASFEKCLEHCRRSLSSSLSDAVSALLSLFAVVPHQPILLLFLLGTVCVIFLHVFPALTWPQDREYIRNMVVSITYNCARAHEAGALSHPKDFRSTLALLSHV
jgi:hypothetical protein